MTGILKKQIDDLTPPDAEARRDDTVETDWFPIFRSGKYPQGVYSRGDIDQIVEEFQLSGRRPPMVFDHLTKDDFGENAKPGRAAGFLIDFRAVDSTDSRYAGSRVLETRAKAGWSARYNTREGGYRNSSVGLYRCAGQDSKKRLAVHHLALLGAAPPQVQGLPEILFSERVGASEAEEILSFSVNDCFASASPSVSKPAAEERGMKDPINFSEHEALLGKLESDLTLKHSTEVAGFREQIATFSAKADAAAAEAAAAKAALVEVEATIPVKEEIAKQAGIAEGTEAGKLQAERLFGEQVLQRDLAAYSEGLRKSGRITEQEFKGDDKKLALATRLFSMPEAIREDFKALLDARPAVTGSPETPAQTFRGEVPSADDDEALASEASRLVKVGECSTFREALGKAKTTLKSKKEA